MAHATTSDTRRYVNLPGRSSTLPFSDGVLVGDTFYLSGRIGIDPVTGQAPTDVDAEIKLLLDGVQAVLTEAGMNMDDLVSVQIFSPDLSLWEPFNAAYVKRFGRDLPARAFIGSALLLGQVRVNGNSGQVVCEGLAGLRPLRAVPPGGARLRWGLTNTTHGLSMPPLRGLWPPSPSGRSRHCPFRLVIGQMPRHIGQFICQMRKLR